MQNQQRELARRSVGRRTIADHKQPTCTVTGLPRYRDRHQGLQAARERARGNVHVKVSTFHCHQCRGYHHEVFTEAAALTPVEPPLDVDENAGASRPSGRRLFLVDIENLTRGARANVSELEVFWRSFVLDMPGVDARDHVVVGAARRVARRYRPLVRGKNVKWVVGHDGADGADEAMLAAIDLHRASRNFDELVIASGDHAFAPLASRARLAGMRVHVVIAEHPGGRSPLARALGVEASAIASVPSVTRLQAEANRAAIRAVARRFAPAVTPRPMAA